MRVFVVAFAISSLAVSVSAANFVFSVSRPATGQWQVFGQLSNNTDNDGLSSIIINVQGSNNIVITSSSCQLPVGTHYYYSSGGTLLSQGVGFTEFRSDGTNGIGVRAGQLTTLLGNVVLVDVGYSAGNTPGDQTDQGYGPALISWSAPVLIASGTYQGLWGTITATVGSGQVNVLDNGRDPNQTGQVHKVENVVSGSYQVLHPGDINGDNKVDLGDLGVMAGNWSNVSGTMTWQTGDLSGDGKVNLGDLSIMAGNWGWSASAVPPMGEIPEPATICLIGLAGLGLAGRRR